jgi:SOS-response transcriptional repressor LexA
MTDAPPPGLPLTEVQRRLLLFIERYMAERGIAPTFQEMCVGIGLSSRSGIFRILDGLAERGFIRRRPCRPRSVEILRRSDEPARQDVPSEAAIEAAIVHLRSHDPYPEVQEVVRFLAAYLPPPPPPPNGAST